MNTRRRPNNTVQLPKIFLVVLLALTAGGAGLCYLTLKNTQHALGDRVRQTERELRELRSRNQDFQSRIARLSSRMALRSAVENDLVALIPVQATAIARLVPATVASSDDVLRTAANQFQRP